VYIKIEMVLLWLWLFACQLDLSPDLETQRKCISVIINHSSANEQALLSARAAAGQAIFSSLYEWLSSLGKLAYLLCEGEIKGRSAPERCPQ